MAAHALALIAVLALAATGAGGIIGYNDLHEFELELKVIDANTGEPIAGASVEVKDANGTLVASGLTDHDGEYSMSIDDHGTDDSDDENEIGDSDHAFEEATDSDDDVNEADHLDDLDDEASDVDDEDESNLGSIVGPLTVTVSKMGYETQTFTVNIDTWDDSDRKVMLVPTVA